LLGIAFTSLVHVSNINQNKRVYVTARIAKQGCIGKTWKNLLNKFY